MISTLVWRVSRANTAEDTRSVSHRACAKTGTTADALGVTRVSQLMRLTHEHRRREVGRRCRSDIAQARRGISSPDPARDHDLCHLCRGCSPVVAGDLPGSQWSGSGADHPDHQRIPNDCRQPAVCSTTAACSTGARRFTHFASAATTHRGGGGKQSSLSRHSLLPFGAGGVAGSVHI
jgi:hypothetical protein